VTGTTARTREHLSPSEARRIAVAAQGLGRRPSGEPGPRHLRKVIDSVGVLQIDSVNVLSRSHYLPLFSRLGPYRRELLDRASARAPRGLVEYWAHEASLIPPMTHRLLRYRMDRAHEDAWGGMVHTAREHPELVDAVREEVARRGPLTARQIELALGHDRPRDRTTWGWNWSATKRVVEFLFWSGEITSAGRTAQFERRYALPETVIPPDVLALPSLPAEDCVRELVRIAARAMGIVSASCLRDYWRLRADEVAPAVADLVESEELVPVRVTGWDRPTYLAATARLPRRVAGRAVLSPFDSLIWFRERTEALFGFRYRIEIYTPARNRVYGYYVLPFLLGDRLVARVDLKADRTGTGDLLVFSAWAEQPSCRGVPCREEIASELASELTDLAGWLGLGGVRVESRGDLAPELAGALRGCAVTKEADR
jgi:uncharacterized protein YcaQ